MQNSIVSDSDFAGGGGGDDPPYSLMLQKSP